MGATLCLRIRGLIGIASCASLLVANVALAAGDASRGAAIAKVWCANCHNVERNVTTSKDSAPSFATIAQSGQNPRNARAFLLAPHPPMPDLNLTNQQIDDILAYLDSLAR